MLQKVLIHSFLYKKIKRKIKRILNYKTKENNNPSNNIMMTEIIMMEAQARKFL